MGLIGFDVKEETFRAAARLAAERGYMSVNGFARSLLEAAVGVVDFNPLSAERHPLYSKREGAILSSLTARPKSLAEVAEETGKWYTALSPVAKAMMAKGWITIAESKYTGGRPAAIYQITEAGQLRLDSEAARRAKLKARADELSHAQRVESAKNDPENQKRAGTPKARVKALDTSTPRGAWMQAAIDALYKRDPEITDEAIADLVAPEMAKVTVMVDEGYTTWGDEQASIEANGWFAS